MTPRSIGLYKHTTPGHGCQMFTRRRHRQMRSSHSQQWWFITPDGSTT